VHAFQYVNLFGLSLSENRGYGFCLFAAKLASIGASVCWIGSELLRDHSVLDLIVQLRHHLLMLLLQGRVFHEFTQGHQLLGDDLRQGIRFMRL